jgi:pectin methylesterase-like acyl-CoA thioesterase
MKNLNLLSSTVLFAVLIGLLTFSPWAQAGTAYWSAGSTSTTNWSDGGNWTGGTGTAGVPGSTDNVIFGNAGTNSSGATSSSTVFDNVVDSTNGYFAGTISSLAYTNNGSVSYHNTLIAPNVTLNITNNTGPFGSALFVGTPTAAAANASIYATISGPGATLNVNNTNAVISITQSGGSGALGTLNMTNLDNFVANINNIAIGDYFFGIGTVAAQGSLILAKTNTITTAWVGNYSSPYSVTMTNAIQLGEGSGSTLGSGLNTLYLGLTNGIFTDSIGVGGIKGGGSAALPTLVAFAPVFTNSSPTAYFRGINGPNSRVSYWGVGDTAVGGSGSSAQCYGKVDFSNGSVDALVNSLIVGRDRNGNATDIDSGVFTFTAGNVNVNSLIVGDQASSTTGCVVSGNMNVNGVNAVLTVNNTLALGYTTLPGPGAPATSATGVLNIFNGTVCASNIVVGVLSVTNTIGMNNATLIVTNTLATNAAGLFALGMTNSTLGLTIGDASLKGLVATLNTGGTTNVIQLASVPVFPSGNYPVQFALIKHTTPTIGGAGFNFGLTNVPATAPGAYLINNGVTIDLYLPVSPAPVITSQPQPFSGDLGSTAILSVTNTGNPTLSYQWYYTNGVSTSILTNGPGPSESSTISGSTNNVLTITGGQVGDNGGYFVVITNVYGAVTSSIAQVTFSPGCTAPIITGPNPQTVIEGNNATFSTTVAANPAASIQWQRNGTAILGATNNTLVVTNVQYPADNGATFFIVASNGCGVVTNSAGLTVIVPPCIITQPVSLVVTNTQAASFSVAASCGVPSPTYQWYKNNAAISAGVNPTATSATLSIASASPSDDGAYYVQVSNAAGVTNSVTVTLTVNSLMSTVAFSPTNGATGICYDTPLYVTFNQPPVLNNTGTIKIYNVTNPSTPVDTLNLALGSPQLRTIGGVTLNAYPVIISGNVAAIYPHSGVMTSNQTYYVTIDNGAFTDSTGAYFVGITAANTWQFTTKLAGPVNPTSLVVAADDSGDFATVQGAIDFIPSGNTTHVLMNIRNGTYTEIERLSSKNNITFRGQNRHQTVITYANDDNINGGTAARPMFGVLSANDVAFENLTLTNSTPKGGSQAEALYINGCKRVIVYNIDLDSFQDTLLVNASGDLAYFQSNHIQGDTDFIWGAGTAFFTNCEVMTLTSGNAQNYENITQARTVAGTNGFSFVNCQLTRLNNTITYGGLGRDLGYTDGNVAYINCLIDAHIVGWNNVDVRYWEYGNSNITATLPVSYNGYQLTNGNPDPRLLLAENATNWLYGWVPALAPNITGQPANATVSYGQSTNFSVSATGIPDPTYQWYQNGLPIANATGPNYSIASAVRTNGGNYTVVVSNGSGSVTSSVATLTYADTAPVTSPATYSRPAGYPLIITIAGDLSTYWSDVDGDSLALTGSISSTNGAAVSYDTNYVYYTNANNVTDEIDYTVGDGFGGNTPGIINVLVGPPPTNSVAGVVVNGDGSVTLNFVGVPDYVYQVDATTNLAPPVIWTTISTNTADISGQWQITDLQATNYPNQFYRSVYRP